MQESWDSFFNRNVDTLRSNPTLPKKLSLKEQQALKQNSANPQQPPHAKRVTILPNDVELARKIRDVRTNSKEEEEDVEFGNFHSANQPVSNSNIITTHEEEEWGDFQTVTMQQPVKSQSSISQPPVSSFDDPFSPPLVHSSNNFQFINKTENNPSSTQRVSSFLSPQISSTTVNSNPFFSPPLVPNHNLLLSDQIFSPTMIASPSINTPNMLMSSPPMISSPAFSTQQFQHPQTHHQEIENADENEWDDFTSASSQQHTSTNFAPPTIVPPVQNNFNVPVPTKNSFTDVIIEWIEHQKGKERIALNSFVQITPQLQVLVMPCKSSKQLPLGLWQTNPTLLLLWIVLQECETIYQVLTQFIFTKEVDFASQLLLEKHPKIQNLLRAIPIFDQILAFGVEFLVLLPQDAWMKHVMKFKQEQWKIEVMDQLNTIYPGFLSSYTPLNDEQSSVCSISGMPVPTNELIFWKQRIMHTTCRNLFQKHGIL